MEQKCANCGNCKWRDGVTAITSTCTECRYVDKGALVPQPSNWIPKVQTNADRIRAKTDKELAELFYDICLGMEFCDYCPAVNNCPGESVIAWEDWLKQPAEE